MSASTRNLSVNAYFARDFGNNLSDDFGTIPGHTPEELRAAGMNVCAHAESAGEAIELLEMLGLREAPTPAHTVLTRDERRRLRRLS